MAELKTKKRVYIHKAIEVNGNVIRFDGHANADKLTITSLYGDVRLFAEAVQNFAIDNGFNEVTIKTPCF